MNGSINSAIENSCNTEPSVSSFPTDILPAQVQQQCDLTLPPPCILLQHFLAGLKLQHSWIMHQENT